MAGRDVYKRQSQGGGLSFVLGGLRPVTDIAATDIALCRIDWTILGLSLIHI